MVDTTERGSKLLNKDNTYKFLSHKTQLEKETNYLDKWQNITEKNIEKQEASIRKKFEQLEMDKIKYNSSDTSAHKIVKSSEKFGTQTKHRDHLHSYMTDEKTKSFHGRPRSGRRATLAGSDARSLVALKKASSTSISMEQEEVIMKRKSSTKLEAQKERGRREARKLDDKCSAFLGKGKSSRVSVPSLMITDERGVSEMALANDGSATNLTSPTKSQTGGRKSSESIYGKSSSFEDLHHPSLTMVMSSAIANNPDEFAGSHETKRRKSQTSTTHTPNKQYIDLAKLKEVEELLHETKQHRMRQKKSGGPDNHGSRAHQRRLDRLKEILDSLKKPEAPPFNPKEMLNCSYLRLSKSNVEELETMIREAGEEPGLHYHSDLTNYDLFAELRKEAEESLKKELELEQVRSERSKSNLSMKSTKSRRRVSAI